jgi:prepilin-type N-terminal cleavage/methylation domain-containing protein
MKMKRKCHGFTLTEMLLSVGMLALIVVFISQLFNSAASLTTTGHKPIDSNFQARQLFARMAVDLAQMIKRTDVDYYVKSIVDTEVGNDRIAFFSQGAGYYPSPSSQSSQSSISLVAYRINANNTSPTFNKMERMGKGLLWNGVSPSSTPMVFGTAAIVNTWLAATDNSSSDNDYETVGPQIFRFEYFYCLKSGSFSVNPGAKGMQDVGAISVCIAVVDPKSKVLLSDAQITTLAGRMNDFSASMGPGDLMAQWQSALDNTNDMPRPTISAVRLYQRSFQLQAKL